MKTLISILSLSLLLLSLTGAGAAATGAKQIRLSDFDKLVSVSDPQISPNDKYIVAVVSRIDMKSDGEKSHLVLIDITTAAERVLTHGHKSVSTPRWSPNGDRLAFLAPGEGTESSPQIFVLPMDGGEAMQVTHAAQGVEQYAWNPDGTSFAYATPDKAANEKAVKAHHDMFEVGDTDYLETSAPTSSHVWLVSSGGGKAERLTAGSWSLPVAFPPATPASSLSWSADGKSLLLTRQINAQPGDQDHSTLQILDLATKKMHPLTGHKKFEGYALFSPDGQHIAYLYPRDGDPNGESEIYVTSTSGGEGMDLTRQLDRDFFYAVWTRDSKGLLVGAHDGEGTSLWLLPLHGAPRKLNTGSVFPSWFYFMDLNIGPKDDLAFTGSTSNHPTELYYMTSLDAAPKRLTDYNAWTDSLDLGKTESVNWVTKDGFPGDGKLLLPPDFEKTRKYPLILVIHGGPQDASTMEFGFFGQVFAAHGFVVFEPNYRGSDNLGNAYEHAIYKDAGAGPGRDVMDGVAAVEKMGFIDPERIAVSGWSYGGFMTSWLIGHYDVWKAAVSGAAVNDLIMEATASDGNRGEYYEMGGSPWIDDNWKLYREESPITHAGKIHAPTLILSDTGDFRVPIVESYEMYHALRDHGVPVKFMAIPTGGHFPGDPVRTEDVLKAWLDWITIHLK